MNLTMLKGTFAAFILSVSSLANAGLMDFDNYADWETNTSDTVLIDFNANAGETGEAYRGNSFQIDGVTFSTSSSIYSIYSVGHDAEYHDTGWLDLQGGDYMATFSQAISSLSFDFGDFYSNAMDLTLTTNTGEIIQGSSLANSYGFIGFTTDNAFTSVTFQTAGTTGAYWGFDNLSYGNASQVPEPTTIAIFALAIMGLASRRAILVNKK